MPGIVVAVIATASGVTGDCASRGDGSGYQEIAQGVKIRAFVPKSRMACPHVA